MYNQISSSEKHTNETPTQEPPLDSKKVYVASKEGVVVALVAHLDAKQTRGRYEGWYVYKKKWQGDVDQLSEWRENYDELEELTKELMDGIDTLVESYPVSTDPDSKYNMYHDAIFSEALFNKIIEKLRTLCDQRKKKSDDIYGLKTTHRVVYDFIKKTGSNKFLLSDLMDFFKRFDNSIEQDGIRKGTNDWYGYKPIGLEIKIGWRGFVEYLEYTNKKLNGPNNVNRNWDDVCERSSAKDDIKQIVLLIDLLVQLGIPINNIPIDALEKFMVGNIEWIYNKDHVIRKMKDHISTVFHDLKSQDLNSPNSPINLKIERTVQGVKGTDEYKKKKKEHITENMKNTLLAADI